MERQLFRYDEIVEGDIDTQSKVMKLLLAGEIPACLLYTSDAADE